MYISINKQLSKKVKYFVIMLAIMVVIIPVLFIHGAYNTLYLAVAVFMYVLVYLLYTIFKGVEVFKHNLYRSVELSAKFLAGLIPVFIIVYLLIQGFAYLVYSSLQEFPIKPDINPDIQRLIDLVLFGPLSYAISITLLRKFSRRFSEYLREIDSLLWILKYVYHFIVLTIVLALSNVILTEYLHLYRTIGAIMVFIVPVYMLGRLTSRR